MNYFQADLDTIMTSLLTLGNPIASTDACQFLREFFEGNNLQGRI